MTLVRDNHGDYILTISHGLQLCLEVDLCLMVFLGDSKRGELIAVFGGP